MSHDPNVRYLLENKSTLFLEEDEYLFIQGQNETGYGSWSPTNAHLSPEKTFRFRDEYNTLRIEPLVAGTPWTNVLIEHEPKIVPNNLAGDKIIFFAFFYMLSNAQVKITVENSNLASTATEYVDIPAFTWTLVRSNELYVPSQTTAITYWATVDIRTSGGTEHFHMAHPVLTNSYGFTQNLFLRELITYAPRFLLETDSEQSAPQFPMSRFLDIGLAYADRGFRQATSFRYQDISDGYNSADNSTKSYLVNPEVATLEYLPWLAQFVGTKIITSAGGTTPWGNLPTTWEALHTDIDPAADVTYNISAIDVSGVTVTASPVGITEGDTITVAGTSNFNGQYLVTSIAGLSLVLEPAVSAAAEATGTITLVDTSWIELEAFDLLDANIDATRRDLVSTARIGHNAGTNQAIIDAVKPILSGNKTVIIDIDPITSPWVITIYTLTSETPEGLTGSSSADVLSAARASKPMGFSLSHECIDLSPLYDESGLPYDSGMPYDGYRINESTAYVQVGVPYDSTDIPYDG